MGNSLILSRIILSAVVGSALVTGTALAAEIKVLISGGFSAALAELAGAKPELRMAWFTLDVGGDPAAGDCPP